MKGRRLAAATIIVAGVAVFYVAILPRLSSSRSLLVPDIVAGFDAATRVEAVRLAVESGKWPDDSLPFAGFTPSTAPIALSSAMKARVRDLLLDGRSLAPQSSACLIEPGVGLRYSAPNGTAEILVCFECDQILVVRHSLDGKAKDSVAGEFGGMRREWTRVAKDIFPADPDIQALAD